MKFSSPKKHVANSIKKISKGHGSQKIVKSLNKTITEHPELTEDAAYQLARIIKTNKVENFAYVIEVMLNIAEVKPDLLASSSDAIIRILEFPKDTFDTNDILKTMEILNIIASSHPELIEPSTELFLHRLSNPNSQIRSASFQVLDTIGKTYPEYLLKYSFDLTGNLHGAYANERLYAAKLIGNIACISSDLIDESYRTIGELIYEHLDTMIRRGSHDATEGFKIEIEVMNENPKSPTTPVIAKKNKFEDAGEALLESYGMGHLYVKPEDRRITKRRLPPPEP